MKNLPSERMELSAPENDFKSKLVPSSSYKTESRSLKPNEPYTREWSFGGYDIDNLSKSRILFQRPFKAS
ncbi:hypothetical protein NPIL_543051 [Nephila pilipes]|uniref:Uncharacterized protein n=1 Tax=Nephila pilipes TaxID=299642 RepID=A0A8X6QQI2_NEPPI|nr:hypothetical protein NPIL_543051 [Nephila pilipes]